MINHYAETLQYAMEKALADKTSIVKNLVGKKSFKLVVDINH